MNAKDAVEAWKELARREPGKDLEQLPREAQRSARKMLDEMNALDRASFRMRMWLSWRQVAREYMRKELS